MGDDVLTMLRFHAPSLAMDLKSSALHTPSTPGLEGPPSGTPKLL